MLLVVQSKVFLLFFPISSAFLYPMVLVSKHQLIWLHVDTIVLIAFSVAMELLFTDWC